MYAPPAFVAESFASVDLSASPFSAICAVLANASSLAACRDWRSSASESDGERVCLRRRDLGGGDLENERDEDDIELDDGESERLRLDLLSSRGERDRRKLVLRLDSPSTERSTDGMLVYRLSSQPTRLQNRV